MQTNKQTNPNNSYFNQADVEINEWRRVQRLENFLAYRKYSKKCHYGFLEML